MKLLIVILSTLSLSSCGKDNNDTDLVSKIRYNLSYNANGATSGSAPTAINVDQGSTITLDSGSDLRRSGYTFAGWNTNASGTGVNYSGGSSYAITTNTTLYAQWEATTNNNSNYMKITIGNTVFTATLTSSATVTAFKAMLPLTLTMSDYNNNEKVSDLPKNLPTTAINAGTIQTGDIMLYGSSSLVLFYKTFTTSYSYTRIGKIDNIAGLNAALGSGSVTIKFEHNGD